MWYEITYPFPDFNNATIQVWEWISVFIPYFTGYMIIHPCCDLSESMFVIYNINLAISLLNMILCYIGLCYNYCQISNRRRTLVGNKIVDYSDVVGAAPASYITGLMLDSTVSWSFIPILYIFPGLQGHNMFHCWPRLSWPFNRKERR